MTISQKCQCCSAKTLGKKYCSKKCMSRQSYIRNKERILAYTRRYRKETDYCRKRHQKIRLNALQIVGRGKVACSNCGCADYRILEINHMNGGGRTEMRQKGLNKLMSPSVFFTRIIKGERKIDDLNILCRVCNHADFVKKKYGIVFRIFQKSASPRIVSIEYGEI